VINQGVNVTAFEGNSDKQAYEEMHAKKTITPIHKGKLLTIHAESYTTSLGPVHTDIVTHPGAVAIIPVNDKGEILLIRQWRRAVEQVLIEIPAGTLEPNEAIEACAQRELQEETGFRANSLSFLGTIHTCPGFCTEKIHLFLGFDLSYAPLPGDDHEVIDQLPLSIDAIFEKIDSGHITDAKTIAAILYYLHWKKKHEEMCR
jgi:ADP-ribose pyrophosphatase